MKTSTTHRLIHDGHRRYARRENLLTMKFLIGLEWSDLKSVSWCDELGINHITSWLLSKENLSRPEEELNSYYLVLNELFQELLIDDLVDNFKINFVGSIDLLPEYLQNSLNNYKKSEVEVRKYLQLLWVTVGGRR